MVTHRKKNSRMRSSTENDRLHKVLKNFSRNGICTQYCYRKIKTGIVRKDMHFTMVRVKAHWRYIPYIKSTQKTHNTKPRRHVAKQNQRKVRTNKIK